MNQKMKLFDEIEKCFPEMEKQFKTLHPRKRNGRWSTIISPANLFLRRWIDETLLTEDSELYRLFKQAEQLLEREEMSCILMDWFIFYMNTERLTK